MNLQSIRPKLRSDSDTKSAKELHGSSKPQPKRRSSSNSLDPLLKGRVKSWSNQSRVELKLQPIGSNSKIDHKAELFSFDFSKKKKSLTSPSPSRSGNGSNLKVSTRKAPSPHDSPVPSKRLRKRSYTRSLVYDSNNESDGDTDIKITPTSHKNSRIANRVQSKKPKSSKLEGEKIIGVPSDQDDVVEISRQNSLPPTPKQTKVNSKTKKTSRRNLTTEFTDDVDIQENDPDVHVSPPGAIQRNQELMNDTFLPNPNHSTQQKSVGCSGNGLSPNQNDVKIKTDSDIDDEVEFVIEENRKAYEQLRNSDLTRNILLVPERYTTSTAGFMRPLFNPTQGEYPGIKDFQTCLPNGVGLGYIKIKGKTIRPAEMHKAAQLVYWILKGSIKVKSAGGHYTMKEAKSGSENQYLFGQMLPTDTCISIPKNTVYTFENWDSSDALLGYCMIRDPDTG